MNITFENVQLDISSNKRDLIMLMQSVTAKLASSIFALYGVPTIQIW